LGNSLVKFRPQINLALLAQGSEESIKLAKSSLTELDTILMEYIQTNKAAISPNLVLDVAKYFAWKVITETKNLYDLSSKNPQPPLKGGSMLPEDIVAEIEALPAGVKAEVLANIPGTLQLEVKK